MAENLLEKHGFHTRKKYGQNFLTDPKIPAKIADLCADFDRTRGTRADSVILEIGPGAGILTKELARRFARVIAVEIDGDLLPVLADALAGYDNVSVVHADIMKTDLAALLAQSRTDGTRCLPVSVCANLPYYITTPVLMKLLEEYDGFSYITVMVQKEVARRLCAAPGSADYGALTAAVGLYAKAEKLFDVMAGSFCPRPKVDSSVVKLSLYRPEKYPRTLRENASRLIRAAFSMRRKTLVNALCGVSPRFETKEQCAALVAELFGDPALRGETLSSDQFAALAQRMF